MRILWITNLPTVEIAQDAGLRVQYTGGWLTQISRKVAEKNELIVAFPLDKGISSKTGNVNSMQYCSFPSVKKQEEITEKLVESTKEFIHRVNPDIIHIWGTEYLHSYVFCLACQNLGIMDRTVLYIQGLISIYKEYYWCYINDPKVKRPTIKDYIRKTGPYYEYKDFCVRSIYEEKAIRMARHIMGRTAWDRYHIFRLNPSACYHFCNETLRESFYSGKWNIDNCSRHRVFISQGVYPIKGLHLAIEGVSKLRNKYPDILLVCTGKNRNSQSLRVKILDSSYDRFIRKLIHTLHMEDNILFLGMCDASRMKEEYLKANVFLSPSSVENSPNSVGEAMILGTPVVASDVGGVRSILENGKEGLLYEASNTDEMARCMEKVFDNDLLAEKLSEFGRKRALQTHDLTENYFRLLEIYKELLLCHV